MKIDDDRTARAALSRIAEPGDRRIGAAVLAEGACRVLSAILDGDPSVLPGEAYRSRLADLDPERDLALARRCNARWICPSEREWPSQLDQLGPGAPLGLWVRGGEDLRLLAVQSVAVVGARSASAYGEHVAGLLGAELADLSWCVVSGGAYGIDAAAHRGAIGGDGATIAVLACGVDVAYPRGNEALFARVLDCGVLVSELPPSAHPTRSRFLERNRVIAALSRGTVVVEAAHRSGALATAGRAESLNRPVLGVPGPITSVMSAGVHAWLREGRMGLVTSGAQIVEALGRMGEDLAPAPAREERLRDRLDPLAAQVLDALPVRRGAALDQIARVSGLPPAAVLSALGALILEEFCVQDEQGWRLHPSLHRSR